MKLKLADWIKYLETNNNVTGCNRLAHGSCTTRSCILRGGKRNTATCEIFELVTWLRVKCHWWDKRQEKKIKEKAMTFMFVGLIAAKAIGYTVIPACPTTDVVARLLEAGERIGADYTEVVPVAGECKKPFDFGVTYDDAIITHVVRGATIGIHKKLE